MNLPISYNWLRSHFDKDIPSPDELAVLFTKQLAEVEGMERRDGDTIFDLKIMPDRGHDLLSHRGVAREVAVLSGTPLKTSQQSTVNSQQSDSTTTLRVVVEDAGLCPRYIGRVVENINVGESPAWLRERLASVGQRSINNIVDITNYVMLEIGQPMHAFDVDKLKTENEKRKDETKNEKQEITIEVRRARAGESITTLDDKEIALTPETLVIADGMRSLAIAGVKGGKDAGVDNTTTSIVFEAANFNAVNTRKTAQRVGIRTDSSKRFEHGLSPIFAEDAMDLATKLLLEICPDAKVGEVVDVYPEPQQEQTIALTVAELNGILGSALSAGEMEGIIKRMDFAYAKDGENFTVTPPLIRLDLTIKEDLAEEIGRVYGFDNIPDATLPLIAFTPRPLKAYYYANMIRDTLIAHGFSEVYTSSFQKEGVFAVENPLAEDKGFVRKDLATGIGQALVLNARNAPLLGLDDIKIFEIGKVFPGVMEENLVCAIGIELAKVGKKKDALTREALDGARATLSDTLDISIEGVLTSNIFEFDLGALLEKLPAPLEIAMTRSAGASLIGPEPKVGTPFASVNTRYTKISAYPFVLRDIALWVPDGVTSDEILKVITSEAGELLHVKRLFDVFTKEFPEGKKTSYAFNLVFQSYEKTLSDEEVNTIMDRTTWALTSHGWQVR